jgi:hypothetical protein
MNRRERLASLVGYLLSEGNDRFERMAPGSARPATPSFGLRGRPGGRDGRRSPPPSTLPAPMSSIPRAR